MSDFFRGWRRKVGCATLVMASMFAMAWIRSRSVNDTLVIEDAHLIVSSKFGRIEWNDKYYFEVSGGPLRWWTRDVRKIPPEYETEEYRDYRREIPYWSITIPLTLLSAALILWPRKRREEPDGLRRAASNHSP